MANVARCAEGALVLIGDACGEKNLREGVLGEALAARERQLTHIEQQADAGGLQGLQEALDRGALVADGEDAHGLGLCAAHERDPCRFGEWLASAAAMKVSMMDNSCCLGLGPRRSI